jgi:putative tricarboxylic transport membrane protein
MGPIIEGRFRQALGTANGDFGVFIERPISATMVAAIIILISLAAWTSLRPKPKLETATQDAN